MLSPQTPVAGRSSSELLAAESEMGAVTLRVANLDVMTSYYSKAVRLTLLAHEGATADHPARSILGRVGNPIVILEHAPELKHASPHEAGLFHTAILFESEEDLATAVYSVAMAYPGSFTGSADHLVSLAFYFDDPEGNGIELYWDRPRSVWTRDSGGGIEMGVHPLDPNTFIRTHATQEAMDAAGVRNAKVGHVHLSVGDIPTATEFYINRLGFEWTTGNDRALFVSAGGYHHHMAMNVWNSRGAGPRQQTLGLGLVRIDVPTADDLGTLVERLGHHGIRTRDDGSTLEFNDPWLNTIQVTALA